MKCERVKEMTFPKHALILYNRHGKAKRGSSPRLKVLERGTQLPGRGLMPGAGKRIQAGTWPRGLLTAGRPWKC